MNLQGSYRRRLGNATLEFIHPDYYKIIARFKPKTQN